MTISYALSNSLRSGIFGPSDRWYDAVSPPPSYENNGRFSRFLEVIVPCSGECFVPVLGISNTISFIKHWLDSVSPTRPIKLSYPLFVGGKEVRKTADSIIQSINNCPEDLRLSNIITSKGLNYYGGQGLIFDENWNPLMLCGYIINIDRINKVIRIVKPVCHVSPDVIENKDILSRAIIKKVVPFISTRGADVPVLFRRSHCVTFNSESFQCIPVTICCLNDFFVTPKAPRFIEHLDDAIWGFLEEHVNDLI